MDNNNPNILIPKIKNIEVLYVDNDENEFNCPICFESIFKKKIFQCKEGCSFCENCWKESLIKKKQCMACRKDINSFDDLSRCRLFEKLYLNKKIYCPYLFEYNPIDELSYKIKDEVNGCKEIIKIDELENHQYQCKYKFIKCPNSGCNDIFRENQIQSKHLDSNQCEYSFVKCRECDQIITRSNFSVHINKECDSLKLITCQYGCSHDIEIRKSNLNKHLSEVNHSSYIAHLIQSKSDQLEFIKSKMNEINKELFQANELLFSKFYKSKDFIDQNNNFNKSFTINWRIPNFINKIKKRKNNQFHNYEIKKTINIGECIFEIQLAREINNNFRNSISIFLIDLQTLLPFKYNYSFNLINNNYFKNINFELNPRTMYQPYQLLKFIDLDEIADDKNGWLSNIDDSIENSDILEINFIINIKFDPNWKNRKL